MSDMNRMWQRGEEEEGDVTRIIKQLEYFPLLYICTDQVLSQHILSVSKMADLSASFF